MKTKNKKSTEQPQKKNASPVCYANSDELREEFKEEQKNLTSKKRINKKS